MAGCIDLVNPGHLCHHPDQATGHRGRENSGKIDSYTEFLTTEYTEKNCFFSHGYSRILSVFDPWQNIFITQHWISRKIRRDKCATHLAVLNCLVWR